MVLSLQHVVACHRKMPGIVLTRRNAPVQSPCFSSSNSSVIEASGDGLLHYRGMGQFRFWEFCLICERRRRVAGGIAVRGLHGVFWCQRRLGLFALVPRR